MFSSENGFIINCNISKLNDTFSIISKQMHQRNCIITKTYTHTYTDTHTYIYTHTYTQTYIYTYTNTCLGSHRKFYMGPSDYFRRVQPYA